MTLTNQRNPLFSKVGKWIMVFIAISTLVVGYKGFQYYQYAFSSNVKKSDWLFIGKDTTLSDIRDSLIQKSIIKDINAFDWVASKKHLSSNIKPGAYLITLNENTNHILNRLISGNQTPIQLTFNNIRFMDELSGRLGNSLMEDSLTFSVLLNDISEIKRRGFSKETFPAMFIPNTYEVYWTISSKELLDRMEKEYRSFWNNARREKAKKMRMTPVDVVTLASIVQEETAAKSEMSRIAGVYYNRLSKHWPLQADPTIKFALGDFGIKRILNSDLETNSPYNTYKNIGLPPGPINFPHIYVVDACLNYEKHRYFYFCANSDFSGTHVFATSLRQHNINASKYQRELNKRRIGFKKNR